jgi:chromosome segregation ATPase
MFSERKLVILLGVSMLGAPLTTALAATTCMPLPAYDACVASQATLQENIATLKSQVSEDTIALKGDQSEEKSLQGDVKSAESSITKLNKQIASDAAQVIKLEAEIANPKTSPAQKTKDNTKMIELQQQEAADGDLITGLTAEVASYNSELTPIEADITAKEAAIATANATIATDETALKALKCVLCPVSPN